MISLEEGVELVWFAFNDMLGGEIYVKKIPSMKVVDIANTIAPKNKKKIVGIRPGEKLHEQMISEEDALFTYEYPRHFKILPPLHNWGYDPKRIKNGRKVIESFIYKSDTNNSWMKEKDLRFWIRNNKKKF
jgi:FlaA1/EpsC-like NDP-sugar epimerase